MAWSGSSAVAGQKHNQRWRHWHPTPRLREAEASWYGPADSGGPLACGGGDLTNSTMGVANKTLPCNTKVRVCLTRRGSCVDVRVVDRGPYVAGREYDLTYATAKDIGFLAVGVGRIWVGVLSA